MSTLSVQNITGTINVSNLNVTTINTSNITVASINASNVAINGATLSAAPDTNENRIINGAFDFWQRGTSHSTLGYGSADRWRNELSGGTVTMSRQSFTIGDALGKNSPKYFLRQAVSGQSLSSHYAAIIQRIEGVSSYSGQTITVLGWAKRNSGSGNMSASYSQAFGTGGSPSAQVNGNGQTVSLTGSWAPFAVTFSIPSIAGKTLGSNGDDSLDIDFWTSAGSDFNSRSNSLGLQTINVDLWGVHIRVGTHTTAACNAYIAPELGPELARCQRYYYKHVTGLPASYPMRFCNYSAGTRGTNCGGTHPVAMRGTPSLTFVWEISDVNQGGQPSNVGGDVNAWSFIHTINSLQEIDIVSVTADAEL